MVVLNRIYTRTGDAGETALGTGERVSKAHLRIASLWHGGRDQCDARHRAPAHRGRRTWRSSMPMLARIQNELFDLGADLCVPDTGKDLGYEPLRILPKQYERIEAEIDDLNGELQPLRSFVLPGGHPAAAHLHLARTICRRAERLIVELAAQGGRTCERRRHRLYQPPVGLLLRGQPLGQCEGHRRRAVGSRQDALMFVPLHDDTPLKVIRFQL